MQLSHLDHIVLRVNDPQQMVQFYTAVLGTTVERELDIGLIQLRAGSALIDLVPVDSELGGRGGAPDPQARNLDHFCFRVEPFDTEAIAAHLRAHDIDVPQLATRYGADGFGPSLYISDPEGNVIELKGPPERQLESPA